MCGIGGIFTESEGTDFRGPLAAMQRALGHRGPDGEGLYISAEACAGLVHTRLAILDLSAAGHQPMGVGASEADSDGRACYWISFNGEIYNFLELREELASQGVVFHSRTDTEVILRLYERDGADCVRRLRGMFAFAIWDERRKTGFLARDPFGIKPLYYHRQGGRLLFGSELRTLAASGLVARKFNAQALFGYLQSGSVPEPDALMDGVKVLPAGHTLSFAQGHVSLKRYWALQFEAVSGPCPDAAAKVRPALLDSVSQHFVSDVPVGIFLSGGIDSSALLALAGLTGHKEVPTFSLAFEDPNYNEGELAARTAAHFGARHSQWRLDAATGLELFKCFVDCIDQPSIDGFNTYTVSRFAQAQGMKVVLSGLGGDELFGGYPSFSRIPQMLRWSGQLGRLGPLRKLVGGVLARYSGRAPMRRLGEFLEKAPTAAGAYTAYRGVFSAREAAALTARLCNCAVESFLPAEPNPSSQPELLDAISEMEIERYMRNQLLRDSDAMSMACGLELRVPFVDRNLMAVLAGLPAAVRLQPGKKLLVEAVPEIPAWVLNQPKRGFVFPFEQWLSAEWKEVFREAAAVGGNVRPQTWYQKWSLFVLWNWSQNFAIALPSA